MDWLALELRWIRDRVHVLERREIPEEEAIAQAVEEQMDISEVDPAFRKWLGLGRRRLVPWEGPS